MSIEYKIGTCTFSCTMPHRLGSSRNSTCHDNDLNSPTCFARDPNLVLDAVNFPALPRAWNHSVTLGVKRIVSLHLGRSAGI